MFPSEIQMHGIIQIKFEIGNQISGTVSFASLTSVKFAS